MSVESKESMDAILEAGKVHGNGKIALHTTKTEEDYDKAFIQDCANHKAFNATLNARMLDDGKWAQELMAALDALPRHKSVGSSIGFVISSCIKTKRHKALTGLLTAYPKECRDALVRAAVENQLDTVREILEIKGIRWDVDALRFAAQQVSVNKETVALLRSWIPKCGVYSYWAAIRELPGAITDKDHEKALKDEARGFAIGERYAHVRQNVCAKLFQLRDWAKGQE